MATETKEFDFKTCPFCDCEYKDSHLIKVHSDNLGVSCLFLECEGCGTIYTAERVISWQVQKIADGKPLSQEVAEFLKTRARMIEEAKRKLS